MTEDDVRPVGDSILDVGGLRVGHWTDRIAVTGCTVILCPPEGAVAAVDVRGGAPGTRETDLLGPGRRVPRIHAVLLTGGSAFGLEAAAGVVRFLEERGIGFETAAARVPIVPGAVIYDLGIGRPDVRPNAESGYQACLLARDDGVEQGSVGAGTGATVAKLGGAAQAVKGGLGSASERLAGGLVVGALAVVNAVGEVVDPADGRVVTPRRPAPGEPADLLEFLRSRSRRRHELGASTVISAVATNAALSKDQALRLAIMAHAGLPRTIRPAFTPADGDTLFALATGAEPISDDDLLPLGALAARALERAILRAVLLAEGLGGVPGIRDRQNPP